VKYPPAPFGAGNRGFEFLVLSAQTAMRQQNGELALLVCEELIARIADAVFNGAAPWDKTLQNAVGLKDARAFAMKMRASQLHRDHLEWKADPKSSLHRFIDHEAQKYQVEETTIREKLGLRKRRRQRKKRVKK
jgi:hypothetical protein